MFHFAQPGKQGATPPFGIPSSTHPLHSTHPWKLLDLLCIKPLAQVQNCSLAHEQEPQQRQPQSQEPSAAMRDCQKTFEVFFRVIGGKKDKEGAGGESPGQ